MSNEAPEPQRDWWLEFATEKIGAVLFAQELRQEDRNGYFTWSWVVGLFLIIGTVWRAQWDYAAGRVPDPWAFLWVLAGIVLFVCGVALRINGGVEIRHLRRLQQIARRGRIPDDPRGR